MPSPYSRHMKNNTFSAPYSDEITIKSISRAQEGNFVHKMLATEFEFEFECPSARFVHPTIIFSRLVEQIHTI
jgi:hypothetical protein